jgi:hypothetical protein
MEVKNLSPEQKQSLFEEFKAEEAAKKTRRTEDRKTLKELSSGTVDDMFKILTQASNNLSDVKSMVFNNFSHLIDMKCELYSVKNEQQSHTFSSLDGNMRISLGCRMLDRYDETAEAGISKVREYMDSLIKDESTGKLVGMINSLLRKDAKGNLKANRVLELLKLANESESELFQDGVQIIADSHRPEQSAHFIEASHKNEEGQWCNVGLSISSVAFPNKS